MSPFKVGFSEAFQNLFTPQTKSSVSLFRHGTLEVKLYAPRKQDPQRPHTRDEVGIVAQGSGTYFYAGERQPFSPGDFLFAPAGVEHRFENFSDDFFVCVLFYGPEGGEKSGDPLVSASSVAQSESPSSATKQKVTAVRRELGRCSISPFASSISRGLPWGRFLHSC